MPIEVNGQHAVAHYDRARVFVETLNYETGQFVPQVHYAVCGTIVITPYFVFAQGHYGENGGFEPVTGIAYPREHVYLIQDQSVNVCETHDEMDAEARALMESAKNAEEDTEN